MTASVTLRRWLISGLAILAPTMVSAQGQAPTLLDDFNRPDSPTVGPGWLETETTPSTGAALVNNQLQLRSGVLGKDFVARDVSSRYSPVLRQNADQLTWLFNMQQSRPNPSGFGPNNYGAAFVLAGSASDFTTGDGYAVVYGNSSQPDSLKLVRYTGGLVGPTNLRTLAAVSVPLAAGALTGPAHTVRVLYAPDEDNWTLEVSANTASFDDPTTVTFVRIGVRKDSTLATTALPWVGCFWNHATTAAENVVFDNIYVTAPCTLGPEPTQGATAAGATNLTSSGVTLSWTASNGTGRIVVVRPASAAATAPTDGSVYNSNANFGSGSGLGAGGFVVYAGTGSTVNVTNLQPNTAYAYQVYELLGSGCTTNYLQATPATGTFTTAPCVLAASPTVATSNGTAVAAGRTSATFSWTSGNGANALVVVQPTGPVTAFPANATGYTGSLSYGGGSALGNGAFVVYAGPSTTTSVTVTNLVPGTQYRVTVFGYNGAGCLANYMTSFFATVVYNVPVPPVGTLLPFRGNIHAHSSYSDGNQDGLATTPLQDFQYADASLNTDFMGISEHNHAGAGMSLPNYARGLQQADQATTASFVALYGMEWGVISGGGHVVVYGVDQLLGWEPGNYDVLTPRNDYPALFREINRRPGAFATLAHPNFSDYGNLLVAPLSARADSAIVGTVLRSGPATSTNTTYSNPSRGSYTSYFQTLLAKGYHAGITIDHDNHNTTFGRMAQSRLVVLAPVLTKADILDALRQRHFYASDDWNAEVSFTLNNQPMGSIYADQAPAVMTVSVSDADNEPVSSVQVLRGEPGSGTRPVVVASAAAGATALSYVDPQGVNTTAYYYAVVAQADGDSIVTSPIWYTRRLITATTPGAEELALAVFPNPTAGTATLSYYLPKGDVVRAEVYDAVGRQVVSLAAGERQVAGPHTLAVPALVPGLYTVRLAYDGGTDYRKLVVE
ncbi:CehA/McbA family metallohydrolase [Hymenobacter terrenus]|uniref:CehA/McbA family metallohydrolase n=1 Tax=Hymenobacter terrenus TaxID=1629124 RepID=UPI000619D3AA|nr:CehA/McbA family metallohydrolase [Hymenobacter terrenus]